jgi:hypothetical protein
MISQARDRGSSAPHDSVKGSPMAEDRFHVTIKLKHPKATVSEVHLPVGQETPIHAHGHDYVVHPHKPTRVLKTT